MSTLRIVNASGPSLNSANAKLLEEYVGKRPDILKLFTLSNIKNALSDETLPNGTVIVVAAGASMDPSLLPSKLFSVLTLYKLKSKDGAALADDAFLGELKTTDESLVTKGTPVGSSKSTAIQQAIAAFCGEGPSLSKIYIDHCDNKLNGQDSASWTPGLGKTGWISISKHAPRRFLGDYYLCVYSSNDVLSDELLTIADDMSLQTDIHSIDGDNAPLTIVDFADRNELKFAKILARRNNDRIAQFVVDKLGVKVARQKPDLDGMVNLTTRQHALVAMPTTITYFGQLNKTRFVDNGISKEAVVVYDRCGNLASSVNGCAVPLSPMEGVALFETSKNSSSVSSNEIMNCVPCGVGYDSGAAKLHDAQIEYVQTCVHWTGKQANVLHPKTIREYRSEKPLIDLIQNNKQVTYKQLQHVFTTLPAHN